jgi:hypothetical protein
MSRLLIASLGVSLILGGCAAQTETGDIRFAGRSKNADGIIGTVTAQSRFGAQTVSGPVRHAANGRLEVRLPGGTWIECVRNCSDTLRRQTVDYWQNVGGGGRGDIGSNNDGPGYVVIRRP